MSSLAVSIRNLSKTYGEEGQQVHAVRDANLDIYQGELFMIMGPSGSGKTTLLSLIGGTLYFETGSIEAFGNSLGDFSRDELTAFRKKYVGFIFQQFHLIPTLNAAENVALPLLIQGIDRKTALKKAETKLEIVGLLQKAERYPKELSGGEQQRVAIARALIHEPRLIISDEPTSSLDSVTGAKVLDTLKAIAKDPTRCVIIVTHDPRILKYADRVAEMSDGIIKSVTKP
jgi:putative ABC transport system ATP-binding protein